jgi:hypothetical protein
VLASLFGEFVLVTLAVSGKFGIYNRSGRGQGMNPEWRKRIQLFLIVLLIVAGIRLFLIYRERHSEGTTPKKEEARPLSADAYVVPHKVHAYDLQSARYLDGKTVWVQAGNQMLYFPYDPAKRRSDFNHPAGLLPPLDKLAIKDVKLETDPLQQRKVMAVFSRDVESKQYATSVGMLRGEDYSLMIDDAFLIDDPRELYKHWPADVWDAIEHHQVKAGMNEIQTSFALGGGVPRGSGEIGNRTMEYSLGDKKTMVTFSNDRATDIQENKP